MNIPTVEQLNELDVFFRNVTIPEVIKLSNGAIVQNNAPKYIETNLSLLKSNQMSGLVAAARFSDLCELRKAIEEIEHKK